MGCTYKMVDRILEQEKAIQQVLSKDCKASHLVLTWQDVDVLTSMHKALEPFADFTDALSGDSYVTISSIKPTLSFIKDAMTATDHDTSLTTDLKANIRAFEILKSATRVMPHKHFKMLPHGWIPLQNCVPYQRGMPY